MIELIVKAVLSYLLGSIVGSLVVGRLRGGVDIRKLGSGNAGGTNALRTQGRKFAFAVLLIDIGKGWMATGVLAPSVLPGVPAATAPLGSWALAVCGLAVMLGHVYPVWHGFRGGKGVATLIGVVLGVQPWLLLPMLLTWLAAVVLFGFVGFASMLGAVGLAVSIALSRMDPRVPLITFGWLTAVLIAFTHRSNIDRMRRGVEPRARKLWLLGHGRRRVDAR